MRRLLGVALFTLVGCGPFLEERALAPHTFSAPEGCGQGPFRLSVDAVGAPWGEEIVIFQRGGRPFTGRFEVLIDGEKVSWGPVAPPPPVFTPGQPAPPKPTPAANRCVLSEGERASTSQLPTPGGTGGLGEPGSETPPVDEPVPPQGPPPRLVEITSDGEWGTELLRFGVRVDAWEKIKIKWKAGAHIEVVLWSDVAIDMTGVTVIVGHHVWSPSGTEAEWRAHLDEEQAESDRKAAERAREAAAHEATWRATTEHCSALSQANAVDDSCRNLGWQNASDDAQGRSDGSNGPAEQRPSEPAPPQPREPDGPPPPPRVEVPTPKPSDHAEWVAGSWSWDGFAWIWLDGGYRVPDEDRTRGATASAPSLPPPPQHEEPPHPPAVGIVWIGGHWHWSGKSAGRWVWIGGRYARPPSRGARWRADAWVRDGARVRLDPGMWIVGDGPMPSTR